MSDCNSTLDTASGTLYPNDQRLTYEEAAEYCEGRGLYLASIHSEDTLDQINKFAADCWHSYKDRWQVGLKMRGQIGKWVDGSTYVSPRLFRLGGIVEYMKDLCRIPNVQEGETYSRLESSARMTGCYSDYRFFCTDVGKKLEKPEVEEEGGLDAITIITTVVIVLLVFLIIGMAVLKHIVRQRSSRMSAVQMSAVLSSAAQVPPPPPPMQGYYPPPQMGTAPMQSYPAPQMGTVPMQGYYPPPQMATAPMQGYYPAPQMATAPMPPYQPAPQEEPPIYEATKML